MSTYATQNASFITDTANFVDSVYLNNLGQLAVNAEDFLEAQLNKRIKRHVVDFSDTEQIIYHNQECNANLSHCESISAEASQLGYLDLGQQSPIEAMRVSRSGDDLGIELQTLSSANYSLYIKNWATSPLHQLSGLRQGLLEIEGLNTFGDLDRANLRKLQQTLNQALFTTRIDDYLAVDDLERQESLTTLNHLLLIEIIKSAQVVDMSALVGLAKHCFNMDINALSDLFEIDKELLREQMGRLSMQLQSEKGSVLTQALLYQAAKASASTQEVSEVQSCFSWLEPVLVFRIYQLQSRLSYQLPREVFEQVVELVETQAKRVQTSLQEKLNALIAQRNGTRFSDASFYQAHDFGVEPREPKLSGSESRNGWLGDHWKTVGATGLLVSLLVGVGGYFGYRHRLSRRQAAAAVKAGLGVGVTKPLLDFPGAQASVVCGTPMENALAPVIRFSKHECESWDGENNALGGYCLKKVENLGVAWFAKNGKFQFITRSGERSQDSFNPRNIEELQMSLPKALGDSLTQWDAVEKNREKMEQEKEVLRNQVVRNYVLHSMGCYLGSELLLHTPVGDIFQQLGLTPDWSGHDHSHFVMRWLSVASQCFLDKGALPLSITAGILETSLLLPFVQGYAGFMAKGKRYGKQSVRLLADFLQFGFNAWLYLPSLMEELGQAYAIPGMMQLSLGLRLAINLSLQSDTVGFYYCVGLFVLPQLPWLLEHVGFSVTRSMQTALQTLSQVFIGQSVLASLSLEVDAERAQQSEEALAQADTRVAKGQARLQWGANKVTSPFAFFTPATAANDVETSVAGNNEASIAENTYRLYH